MTTNQKTEERRFLFLLASNRRDGNTEQLARHAACSIDVSAKQVWLRLDDLPLPPFSDIRHHGDGIYPPPEGHGSTLLDQTLKATDLVFVAPLYWYSIPANLKLYLDHWSGWMRVPQLDFRSRMAGKRAWAITTFSDDNMRYVEPLLKTLQFSTEYMKMQWRDAIVGFANRPGEIEADANALAAAHKLFLD